MPERARRLTLLRRTPQFRLLFLATLGSAVGTYLAAVALTVHVYDQTGSGTWVAALLVANFLPIVAIGLTLGPLVDRLSRRRLMIASDVARMAVFVALVFVESPAVIVALTGVAGVAAGFFRPAVFAGLPNLVPDDDDLTEANALLQAAENVAWMVGPVVAGVLVAAWGPDPTYWINAVTFLFSAVLVSRIPARALQSAESLSRGHWRDVRDGIDVVLRTSQLRTVLVVWNIAIVGVAAINVAEVVFAKEVLDAGDIGFGVIVGATGVGLVVGSMVTPFVLGGLGLRRFYVGSIAVMGLGWIAAALAPTIWLAAPLAAVASAGNGGAIVCNQLLVQRGASDELRGRALAVLMSSTYATLAIAMAAAGPLTNALGARAMWLLGGAVYLAGAGAALAMTRALVSVESRTAVEDDAAFEPPEAAPSL